MELMPWLIDHNRCLNVSGWVQVFGSAETNLFGNGAQADDSSTPMAMTWFKENEITLDRLVEVCNGRNCIAIAATGALYGWGWDFGSQPVVLRPAPSSCKDIRFVQRTRYTATLLLRLIDVYLVGFYLGLARTLLRLQVAMIKCYFTPSVSEVHAIAASAS